MQPLFRVKAISEDKVSLDNQVKEVAMDLNIKECT
jgi:hypothetical protein